MVGNCTGLWLMLWFLWMKHLLNTYNVVCDVSLLGLLGRALVHKSQPSTISNHASSKSNKNSQERLQLHGPIGCAKWTQIGNIVAFTFSQLQIHSIINQWMANSWYNANKANKKTEHHNIMLIKRGNVKQPNLIDYFKLGTFKLVCIWKSVGNPIWKQH